MCRTSKCLSRLLTLALAIAPAACDLMTHTKPLASGVEFTLQDGYDLNGTAQGVPAPYLDMATIAIYGCMNYPLLTSVNTSATTTTIELKGVRQGGVCLTATGPARFRMRYDLPAGRSTLVIRGDAGEDRYTVTATSSTIEISPASGAISGTSIPRSWRVPQNTFAARCETPGTRVADPVARCRAFQDSLTALPGLTRFTFGSGATPPSPPFGLGDPSGDERIYSYAGDATLVAADAIVHRLARNDSAFYLSLRTWKNETHLSWWP